MLNAQQSLELAERVLKMTKGADQAEVDVNGGRQSYARFGQNFITEDLSSDGTQVSVTFVTGKRQGNATTEDLSASGLRKVVSAAAAVAKASPPNPEFVSLAKKAPIAKNPPAVFSSTAKASPDALTDKLLPVFDRMRASNLSSAGFVTAQYGVQATANSLGVRASYEGTLAGMELKAMAANTSGFANYWSRDFSTLDSRERAELAATQATVSNDPQDFAPGTYTVIMDPIAFADCVGGMLDAMNIGDVLQDQDSWMIGKIGKQILSPNLSIVDDWSHPAVLNAPFANDGAPTQKVTLIEKGVPLNYVSNTYLANKYKKPNTGHPGFPVNAVVMPGTKSRAQLIAQTERGILVCRTWYTRVVDPQNVVITGLTRDGVFLIENGKLTKALKNFRFTTSMISALSDAEFGDQVYMVGNAADAATNAACPVVKMKNFTFSAQASFA